jgi:hypothetical protein
MRSKLAAYIIITTTTDRLCVLHLAPAVTPSHCQPNVTHNYRLTDILTHRGKQLLTHL